MFYRKKFLSAKSICLLKGENLHAFLSSPQIIYSSDVFVFRFFVFCCNQDYKTFKNDSSEIIFLCHFVLPSTEYRVKKLNINIL